MSIENLRNPRYAPTLKLRRKRSAGDKIVGIIPIKENYPIAGGWKVETEKEISSLF